MAVGPRSSKLCSGGRDVGFIRCRCAAEDLGSRFQRHPDDERGKGQGELERCWDKPEVHNQFG